ncbi:MAG: UbiX family flavin prenyltransferase [Candidatus Diapherotrites archaeon]|nr:UbiX family flavin prenyltransferase [Candidatus Diapherotrites archaeon]
MRILVAVTGASGFPLATTLLKALEGHERHVIISRSAGLVAEHEGGSIDGLYEHKHDEDAVDAPVCSGSFQLDAMVIVPCSMNTLAKVANGIEDNAITRSAGVNLKQEKKVILVPRETPLNLIQLRNLVKAKEAGCSIVPPLIAYYPKPETVQDCTNHITGRVLELLGIEHNLYTRWA